MPISAPTRSQSQQPNKKPSKTNNSAPEVPSLSSPAHHISHAKAVPQVPGPGRIKPVPRPKASHRQKELNTQRTGGKSRRSEERRVGKERRKEKGEQHREKKEKK